MAEGGHDADLLSSVRNDAELSCQDKSRPIRARSQVLSGAGTGAADGPIASESLRDERQLK